MSNKVKFTKNQEACIEVNGRNILVSAAAGSGKTAVLVERVIRLLTDNVNPISADRLVIVTFTVAAADEMRQRISNRLSEMIEIDSTNQYLQNQQLLLANAKICTIHSLCSGLIRDNFQKLSLPTEFRIADETELELIKKDAIDEVVSLFYDENNNEDFLELVEFFYVKDDKRLCEMILAIYDYIRSFAFPKKFLEESLNNYTKCIDKIQGYKYTNSIINHLDTGTCCDTNSIIAKNATESNNDIINQSIWYNSISSHVESALEGIVQLLLNSIAKMENDSVVIEKYQESFVSDINQIKKIIELLKNGEWDSAVNNIHHINKIPLKSIRNYENKDFLTSLQDTRKQAYKTIEMITKRYLLCTESEFMEDMEILQPKIKTLFIIVSKVYDKIEEVKLSQAVIDYADLEHYTVKLLVEQTADGYTKTATAIELSESFDEIMIDECQDINEVQNLIFKVLSKDEKNLFMVGDVKQSIYRFRKAMPKLFVDKKHSFPKYNGENFTENEPVCITLEKNFRSRHEVCEATNFIFSQIMSEEMGEIEYNLEESLVPAAKYDDYENAYAEVHIIDYYKDDEATAGREKMVIEAQYIAKKIQQMVQDGYKVKDNKENISSIDGMRPCKYEDFAILIRAKKEKSTIITEELKRLNIPCFSDSTDGYFNEYEIAVILNLLHVIDNPLLDVCLLSVLMSPMFLFSADDIAEIRLCDRDAPLYVALTKSCQKGNNLAKNFLDTLNKLRQKAITVTMEELIQEIYDQTDFIALSYALGNGIQKDANLRLLLIYAKQYESIGSYGLSGFLRYIDRIVENKQDFSCANTLSAHSDTVKIMSIHSSKGLEFPICIVADCAKKFNKMDLNRTFQMNGILGFGMKINQPEKMQSYPNLPFEAIRLQTEKETISEEMRILYVGMTRAKEKLIMVMTIPKAKKKIASIMSGIVNKKSSFDSQDKLSPYTVFSADSYADWILSAVAKHSNFRKLCNSIGIEYDCDIIPVDDCKIRCFYSEGNYVPIDDDNSNVQKQATVNDEIVSVLQKRFDFKYAYEPVTKIPAKLTATKIAAAKNSKQHNIVTVSLSDEPKFMQKNGITPAERGSILHLFMQFANYENAEQNLENEITRLVTGGFITKEQAQALNRPKINAFLDSKLYKKMKSSARVLREYKFLYFIKAGKVYNTLVEPFSDEKILIQGIADCLLFDDNNNVTLIDYKTDFTDDAEVLINRYYDQMKLYNDALIDTFHPKSVECILYSLHMERVIHVEIFDN